MSPILKLYVQDKPNFQFLKPVEVMLPHYLDLTSEDDSLGIEFLRAGHTMNSNQMYEFKKMGESNKGTFKNNFGILFTKHFWFFLHCGQNYTTIRSQSEAFLGWLWCGEAI